MRYFYMAAVVVCLGAGCARMAPARTTAMALEVEQWQRRYDEERERVEALAVRLAEAEAALEARRAEQVEGEQAQAALQEELTRARSERHALREHNTVLRVRQRELQEVHEELSDVWYESALSRARRHQPARPTEGGDEGGSP